MQRVCTSSPSTLLCTDKAWVLLDPETYTQHRGCSWNWPCALRRSPVSASKGLSFLKASRLVYSFPRAIAVLSSSKLFSVSSKHFFVNHKRLKEEAVSLTISNNQVTVSNNTTTSGIKIFINFNWKTLQASVKALKMGFLPTATKD